jgi:hypothetical protein
MGRKDNDNSRESQHSKNAGVKYILKHKITFILLAVVVIGVVGWGILQSPITLSSGFMSSTFSSVNGYDLGTSQFTESGQFAIPWNGMTFKGRLQYGNVYYDGYSDLGWVQDGNTSRAVQKLYFHQTILGYTFQTVTDQIPGINLREETLGLQYKYQYYDFWGTHLPDRDQSYYLTANTLSIPPNWFICVNQRLDMNVEMNIKLDVSLLGFESFNTTDQYFNYTGSWVGVLNAKSGDAFTSGFVNEPGTTIINSNFTNPPIDSAGLSGGNYAGPTSSGEFGTWIAAHDPSGGATGFNVLTSAATIAYQAGGVDLGMGSGDPITLTEGDFNANASIDTDPDHYLNFFSDSNRGNVMGYIPLSIRPQTTITSTSYTYNEIHINQDYWGGVNPSGSGLYDRTVTRPTTISVKNRWIMQLINYTVLAVSDYEVHPLNCGNDCTDIEPPKINGTDDVFNPSVTNSLNAVGGGTNLWNDVGNFFGQFWWIFVVAIIVVIVVVWVFFRIRSGEGVGNAGKDVNVNINMGPEQQRIQQPYGNMPYEPNVPPQYKISSRKGVKMKSV